MSAVHNPEDVGELPPPVKPPTLHTPMSPAEVTEIKVRPKNQEYAANIFTRFIFGFLTNLIMLGNRKQLDDIDLWELADTDEARSMYSRFRVNWDFELKQEEPRVGRALIKTFFSTYIISLIWQSLAAACALTQPVILGYLVGYLRYGPPDGGRDGYLFAMGFALVALLRSLCLYQSYTIALRTGVRMRIMCIIVVYQKTLRISSVSRADMDTGQLVSLISNDAQRVYEIFMFLNEGILALPQIIVIIGLLYRLIYAYTFAGLGVLLVIVPINMWAMTGMEKSRSAMILNTDYRTKLINEVLQAIKVVKFYAWERSFEQTISEAREKELVTLRAFSNYRAIVMVAVGVMPNLMAMVAFITLGVNNPLFPEIIFSALALFELLRMPLTLAPMVLASIAQLSVAMERVKKFLTLPELVYLPPEQDILDGVASLSEVKVDIKPEDSPSMDDASLSASDTPAPSSPISASRSLSSKSHSFQEHSDSQIIRITNGAFKWGAEKDDPISLRNVNFSCSKGQLVMVVGQVGSGKSTLVNALLGEIDQVEGSLYVNGSIGYVPQQAWIVNQSLRNNILFGLPFDEAKYEQTIEVASLRSDLEMLPGGDQVEIGERGVNLSGGQKQRVAIARAVYAQTDIVVLDDPLSAVDAHVGRHIFHECVRGVLKDRAVVMVTNQLQYLPHADYIVVIKNGTVVESGTYTQLLEQKLEFATLIESFAQTEGEYKGKDHGTTKAAKEETPAGETKKKAEGKIGLIDDEERQEGLVEMRVWWHYFQSPGTIWIFLGLAFLCLIEFAVSAFAQYWLSLWSQDTSVNNAPVWLGVYGGLIGGGVALTLCRSFWHVWFSVSASRKLHHRLLSVVLRFPQTFFDTNPLGRILNRFTKDIDNIDLYLPDAFGFLMICVFIAITSIVVVGAVSPFSLIPMAPLAVIFFFLTRFYRRTSVELQRLESLSRGPVLSHFSETIAGRSSIRAFKAQQRFGLTNFALANRNTRALLTLTQCNQWLGLRLDALGAVLLFLVAVILVSGRGSFIGAGVAALGLTQALGLQSFVNLLSIQYSQTETKMNAPERVDEYADMPQEAPAVIPETTPPPSWPSRGEVRFEHVYMRYRPGLPYVIQDLSVTFNGGEKVGVVGRTGAGKSSVMLLLFRIIELPRNDQGLVEGKIFIDDIDISTIGLDDLRLRLAIIPQDPFLFSGTVRSNLDPFGERTDDEVWEVLKHIQLEKLVRAHENQLLYPVFESGENFSVGQRQLICLGRALLRKPKILLMDEATASVDVETDALIQKTVREQFADSTIITIAHRINTVIDYDRIMVLNRGLLTELDTPANLMRNPAGVFLSLVNDTGAESAAFLRTVAFAKESKTLTPLQLAKIEGIVPIVEPEQVLVEEIKEEEKDAHRDNASPSVTEIVPDIEKHDDSEHLFSEESREK